MSAGTFFSHIRHRTRGLVSDVLKYIGPGLLVTVGFIDPGNWAANIAAGAEFGYTLLWMVTLGTLMLILLQHNAAHLGIVTGYCLAEAATFFLRPRVSVPLLLSAWIAAMATAMAEILGGAIALRMLTGLPLKAGAIVVAGVSAWMVLRQQYSLLEKYIVGFVSAIGIAFVFELVLVKVHWVEAATGWVTPSLPEGSILVVMSVLGAVVMPHNLFLHSEIIQSRGWNRETEEVMVKLLKFEFLDTIFSMVIGWAINSAMIIVAAAAFFSRNIKVTDLAQAELMLRPLLGKTAAGVFAVALLFAGVSSSITAAMSGASIFAGMFGEPYNSQDPHTRLGAWVTLAAGTAAIFFISDPFHGLIMSQVALAIQLPFTVLLQISLTSSRVVMGKFANQGIERILLWMVAAVVIVMNVMLLRMG